MELFEVSGVSFHVLEFGQAFEEGYFEVMSVNGTVIADRLVKL